MDRQILQTETLQHNAPEYDDKSLRLLMLLTDNRSISINDLKRAVATLSFILMHFDKGLSPDEKEEDIQQ